MSAFTAVCVDLANTSYDMNIIMWLFTHLACKEVYHKIIYAQLVSLYFGEVYHSLLPRLSSHPELAA